MPGTHRKRPKGPALEPERALGGELTHHLGYPAGGVKPDDTTNHRNGTSEKTGLTDDGP
jgi:transposase-like protein